MPRFSKHDPNEEVQLPLVRVRVHKSAEQAHEKLVTESEAAILEALHNGPDGNLEVVTRPYEGDGGLPGDPKYRTTTTQAERDRLLTLYGRPEADKDFWVNLVFGIPSACRIHEVAMTEGEVHTAQKQARKDGSKAEGNPDLRVDPDDLEDGEAPQVQAVPRVNTDTRPADGPRDLSKASETVADGNVKPKNKGGRPAGAKTSPEKKAIADAQRKGNRDKLEEQTGLPANHRAEPAQAGLPGNGPKPKSPEIQDDPAIDGDPDSGPESDLGHSQA